MTENRIFILCRMITWVVFLRMFWNFISSLPVKRGGSLSFLVGAISNVLVMEIGWPDVGSGGYISTSILLADWNNILQVDMSLHSDTLSWFQALLLLLHAAYLVEKQQCYCLCLQDLLNERCEPLHNSSKLRGVWYLIPLSSIFQLYRGGWYECNEIDIISYTTHISFTFTESRYW
jgi:hypothetical protein